MDPRLQTFLRNMPYHDLFLDAFARHVRSR